MCVPAPVASTSASLDAISTNVLVDANPCWHSAVVMLTRLLANRERAAGTVTKINSNAGEGNFDADSVSGVRTIGT